MKGRFFGRKTELQELGLLFKKYSASLVVVTGRRRIGKSRLIQEFAKDHTFYHFTGFPPTDQTTVESQLKEFGRQLQTQTNGPLMYADDWTNLFFHLAERTQEGRVIILFDEISWMGSKDPDFLGKLKNAWDLHFKSNPQLILILCGSASAWIDKNILSSTGFLGRVSYRLNVEELPLEDCNKFWTPGGDLILPYEKLKVLSVTGGVPLYLEELKPALSAEENIRLLSFRKGGLLVREFENIFSDLFARRSTSYKHIVQALAQGPAVISELCKRLRVAPSGYLTESLNDLVKSGFVSRDYTWRFPTGDVTKTSQFRLSDNYIRFYLKYIDPKIPKIEKNNYDFTSLGLLPGWHSIMGLQFENLVLQNRHYIKQCLNLAQHDIESNNPFFQKPSKSTPGCQIDYLIQSRLGVLYVCEIKFSGSRIGKDIIKEVQQKIDRLIVPKRLSIVPVLIHVNDVTDEVLDSAYFAKIIDFGDIFKQK